ncbi:hypothetical protein D3C87_1935740 [compost metagenome]
MCAIDFERRSKFFHDGLCDLLCLGELVQLDKDGEFIAADPRNERVGQKACQSRSNKGDQFIPCGMAE